MRTFVTFVRIRRSTSVPGSRHSAHLHIAVPAGSRVIHAEMERENREGLLLVHTQRKGGEGGAL